MSGAEADAAAAEALEATLASCTESGRLARASKLVGKVDFLLPDGELIIGAVANYNVVIDISARCIQHGCRDFQGQAPTMHLCKHVAATIMSLDPEVAARIASELADSAAAPTGVVPLWRFEVITKFTPGG